MNEGNTEVMQGCFHPLALDTIRSPNWQHVNQNSIQQYLFWRHSQAHKTLAPLILSSKNSELKIVPN